MHESMDNKKTGLFKIHDESDRIFEFSSSQNFPSVKHDWVIVRADEIYFRNALIQSKPTTVALRLEPIKVLSVIGQRKKEHSWKKFQVPMLSDSFYTPY